MKSTRHWLGGKSCTHATGSEHLNGDRSALVRWEVLVEQIGELHKYLGPPAPGLSALIAVATTARDEVSSTRLHHLRSRHEVSVSMW